MQGHTTRAGDFTTNGQIVRLSGAAVLVGAACAVIAIALLKAIYLVTNIAFFHRLSFQYVTPTDNHLGVFTLLPPIIGALAIGFIARFGSEKIRGHGIPEAIEAMLVNGSKVQPKVAFWKPISAAISIGSGGPFGAEGPIIMTGGSFGSLLGQWLHTSSIERRILLVAGAAGGMSATFSAPVSAVLFAVELLVFEFKPRSLVPIALASSVADVIRIAWIGPGPIFPVPSLHTIPYIGYGASVGLGFVGSLAAIVLTRSIYGMEDLFRKLPVHWMWWPALGAMAIGLGGIVSPRALGVGYDTIAAVLNTQLSLHTVLILLVVKALIWVIALGSGTSGGILAPILLIGGCLGEALGVVMHAPHPGLWALLGMSAVFSGVTRTPFTSVIFPIELTHDFGALLPLLITSCIATGTSAFVLRRSILTERIARRGLHLTREYSVDPLEMHLVREIVSRSDVKVSVQAPVRHVAKLILESQTEMPTWIELVDTSNHFVGAMQSTAILHSAKRDPSRTIGACMGRVVEMAADLPVKRVLDFMIQEDLEWVRINDEQQPIGFVSVQQLLKLRERYLQEEQHRQRTFSLPWWQPTIGDGSTVQDA
ncbi:chloride channel protein [Alicyclobacillus hesperidum]|uniref:Chloride channel protein n=1 Tax=Alicyclobacillus hesperidum TaxID=89784 RepID=A0A1H2Y0A8_9BACL|nr:chloride channel protein [Alicyclobacillus hesperidum]GLV14457.1 chloride channel protein [Alicyclobacillus hesperidum]SDW98587.1 H+/Cl-antiporter ClcA [Alicyclobacillus hesperidum]